MTSPDSKPSWLRDPLLTRVLRNSSYLFGSHSLSAGLSLVQGILAVRLLGIADWGLVTVITTFAVNVNRLLTFRMSEVVVKHMGAALTAGKKDEAAAVVKAAGLVEIAMSALAFLVVLALAPWGAVRFGNDPQTTHWFSLYGIILLGNLLYETSTGVLQATRRFNRQAGINLTQSGITFGVVGAAFLVNLWVGGLPQSTLIFYVLMAYILGKVYAGLSVAILALCELKDLLGPGWWRVPLKILPGKRGLAFFALNTNLNGTVNLFVRDNIPLYMSSLLGTTEVGYFNIAMKLITPIQLILDPFIWPTYVEITDSVAAQKWAETRRLLKRVSLIAAGVVGTLGGGLALVGWWLIPALYGAEAAPAYPVLLILLAGYGTANVLQWNRPLLLALGKPQVQVAASALVGAAEVALIFWLVLRYGYLMMAAILSGYFILSIGYIAWRGLHEINRKSQ
ncbi:MAG: lipopolysaccharide biosynthesis protein [Chloroflexota bacterium]